MKALRAGPAQCCCVGVCVRLHGPLPGFCSWALRRQCVPFYDYRADFVISKGSKASAEKIDMARPLKYISAAWKICIRHFWLFHLQLLFTQTLFYPMNFTLTNFFDPRTKFRTTRNTTL